MNKEYKYLRGPYNSRRLGLSLGVDTLKFKSCPFDCVYCECGKTTNKIVKREMFYDYNEIIKEIDNYLSVHTYPDFITFSGSGEPLLYLGISKIIEHIKKHYKDLKICVITCSYNIYEKEILEELHDVDIVMPSLDAVYKETFYKINQPHKDVDLDMIINGLIDFRKNFKNQIWLEIFIIDGINDTENEMLKFSEIIKKIKPDKIHLNSLDRRPAYNFVHKTSLEKMQNLKKYFEDFEVEII